jgi:hypothetical protein
MDPALITGLLGEITDSTGGPGPTRLPLRVWSMSGVERLTNADGSTAILKYARGPFTREDEILRSAAQAGVPVPRVLGSAQGGGLLVMVLEDLGDPLCEADDSEAATAAAVLHAAVPPPWLPKLDQSALAALPGNALNHLQRLQAVGRWTEGIDDLTGYLHDLELAADKRAADAHTAPFGWVHSEYHSSSLHIGPFGPRLLDFAHSFAGPCLLDLAAWQGLAKAQPPDPERLHAFIGAYIGAGGHPEALARRGGLSPERWALGWHRVWAVEWFFAQARIWINDPAKDPGSVKVVRRHLAAAVDLLAA